MFSKVVLERSRSVSLRIWMSPPSRMTLGEGAGEGEKDVVIAAAGFVVLMVGIAVQLYTVMVAAVPGVG
jgi:hypothetical protein